MAKDLMYFYDKLTLTKTELGEIQSDFNMSFVIDGTKDSCKVIVFSFDPNEVEPMTIMLHSKTNTWWVVSSDKVERYVNENGSFIYTHTLDLIGAVELLNARDLTDCGFNDRTYTVQQFISRLFNLSSFELPIIFDSSINSDFLSKQVDFIKTFENYTLLSALREFLDAYNMCLKISFNSLQNGNAIQLSSARLHIIPKTGDYSLTQYYESSFDNVKETKTISKESYGTCVVSNAENVISSNSKTYPSLGAIKASGTEYIISPENAVIRLPSNVYKANWLKVITTRAVIRYEVGELTSVSTKNINITSDSSLERGMNAIIEDIRARSSENVFALFIEEYNAKKEQIFDTIKKAFTVTLYNGNYLNPITGNIEKGANVPYLVKANFYSKGDLSALKDWIFCDEETRNNLPNKYQGICWKRGSNIISGFDCFDGITGFRQSLRITNFKYTDLQQDTNAITFVSVSYGSEDVYLSIIAADFDIHFGPSSQGYGDVQFIVNYIPMSDVKIKVENDRDKLDIQLYNQNGRLIDNVALSKLLNSYSKEISSDNITKYANYYSFDDVPKVGSIVYFGNIPYVINNVSMTFTQNESDSQYTFGYFIDCEFTMSKYFATKSLLVNPNTNIRDYGIPQNFNVKRKQLYRDYYELDYSYQSDANLWTPLLDTQNIFDFGNQTSQLNNFISVIRLGYSDEVEGQTNWYYQLETTNYYLNKMLCVIVDFNDNNTIGFCSQNVFSGFIISRIFDGLTDNLNTPISYTDADGKVESIDLLFCTNQQITNIYDDYQDDNGGSSWDGSLYNYSVFIPSDIYNAAISNHKIEINEPAYRKDALEVPVFEYCCQIEDSSAIKIGEGILSQYDNCLYFYTFISSTSQHFTTDNVFDNQQVSWSANNLRVNNGVKLTYDNKKLYVDLYASERFDTTDNSWHYGSSHNISSDYVVLDYIQNSGTQYINLGLVPAYGFEYELDYTDVSGSGSNYVMGSRVGTSTIYAGVTGASATRTITVANTDLSINNYRLANKRYYVKTKYLNPGEGTTYLKNITDGDEHTGTQNVSLSGATANVCIFALNSSNIHSGMKVHSLKIWQNGVLVRDLIPVKKVSNNEVGLYDKVNNVLYTNSGSGSFLTPSSPTQNAIKDIAVFRIAYNTITGKQTTDLLFVANDVPNSNKLGNRITLFTNYYKLK